MTWNQLTRAQQDEIRGVWQRCCDAVVAHEAAAVLDPDGLALVLAERLWSTASDQMAALTIMHGLSIDEIRANL